MVEKQRIQFDSPLDALLALAKRLAGYESQTGMESEEFFARFNRGELDDDALFIDWANDYRHYWLCATRLIATTFNQMEQAEMPMNYRPYIASDPSICGGEPVIAGTRVTVRTVLASLAEGMTAEDILQDFPTLNLDAIRAVVAFAAVSAEEDLPMPAIPMLA